jgi:hypothetical protein
MGRQERQAKKTEAWNKIKNKQGDATDEAFDRHGGRPKHGETSGKGPRLGIRKKK